jgi:hypothetical protein
MNAPASLQSPTVQAPAKGSFDRGEDAIDLRKCRDLRP